MTSPAGTGSSEIVSLPASIRAMSRTSLISPRRCRPPRRMCSTPSRCSEFWASSSRSWAKPRIPLSGEQQHQEHEARRQQPVDPAGVEAEIPAAGVEDRGQRDVEDPCAHHDHEPQVEHRVRPAPPQDDQREEAQCPDARADKNHRRGVAGALDDRREEVPSRRDEEGDPTRDDGNRRDTGQDSDPGSAPRPASLAPGVLEQHVRDDEERESAVPEHVQPGGGLRPGAEETGRREQAGERERVRDGDEGREQVAAGQHEQRPRPQDTELTKEQTRGDQIVDHER